MHTVWRKNPRICLEQLIETKEKSSQSRRFETGSPQTLSRNLTHFNTTFWAFIFYLAQKGRMICSFPIILLLFVWVSCTHQHKGQECVFHSPTGQPFYLAIQLQKTFSSSFLQIPCLSFPMSAYSLRKTGIHFINSVTITSMVTVFINGQHHTEVKWMATSLTTGIQFQDSLGTILFTTMSRWAKSAPSFLSNWHHHPFPLLISSYLPPASVNA
jgi:hypothetical protein